MFIILPQMTSGEIKFALQVEMVLNRIPQPEYRQLMVEGMMVLIMIVQHDSSAKVKWDHIVYINEIVKKANAIFIDEQVIYLIYIQYIILFPYGIYKFNWLT